MRSDQAGQFILNKLLTELPGYLSYHNADHTLDVHNAVLHIGRGEAIAPAELELLQTAAWYHDAGYLKQIVGHEAESCRIAKNILPTFDYTTPQIELICGMIMATHLPQSPHNHLEQILADADLDYLGRDDFFGISKQLYLELYQTGVVSDEHTWNLKQIAFMESHQYFTATAIKLRQAQKEVNLAHIKATINKETIG